MLSIADILNEVGLDATERIKQNLVDADRIATSGTYQSVQYKVVGDLSLITLTIEANKNIVYLEQGRGATKKGSRGSTVLFDAIVKWVEAKGIVADIDNERLAYAITNKINREGYEGTKGLYTDVLNDDFIKKVSEQLGRNITTQLANGINSNPTTSSGDI
jgi:hypothetical protein